MQAPGGAEQGSHTGFTPGPMRKQFQSKISTPAKKFRQPFVTSTPTSAPTAQQQTPTNQLKHMYAAQLLSNRKANYELRDRLAGIAKQKRIRSCFSAWHTRSVRKHHTAVETQHAAAHATTSRKVRVWCAWNLVVKLQRRRRKICPGPPGAFKCP